MQSFYSILNAMDVLEVTGEDSEKFLQGQLTCDVNQLAENTVQLGAVCTSKGRVYSSFRLLHLPSRYLLVMQPGMLEITRRTLQKYIPFYKAAMADRTGDFHRVGLAGMEAEKVLESWFGPLPAPNRSAWSGDLMVLNLSGNLPRYELWVKAKDTADIDIFLERLPELPLACWQVLDMEAGICLIQAQATEHYTPEELGMDLAGFVSFNKGCYTGQEIVARMHYRGKAKKRLFLVSAESARDLAGNALDDDTNNTLGMLFNILKINNIFINAFVVARAQNMPSTGYLKDTEGQRVPARIKAFPG